MNLDWAKYLVTLGLFLSLVTVTACVEIEPHGNQNISATNSELANKKSATAPPQFTLQQRLRASLPEEKKSKKEKSHPGGKYNFQAENLLAVEALRLFADQFNLNLVIEPDVVADAKTISVSFRDLPFEKAMEAMLDVYGYHWTYDDGLIRVYKMETRIFTVDYLRLTRGAAGSTSATVSMQAGGGDGGSGGGGGDNSNSTTSITREDSIPFWEELTEQVETMLSEDGVLIVNETSGLLQVTDTHQHVVRVGKFLNKMGASVHRQVEIEAKIFEVALKDDFALGVDWNRINIATGISAVFTSAYGSEVSPTGVSAIRPVTTTMTYDRGDFGSVLTALREQGNIKIVSQPRIITLNNQPAIIKVGTDQPYFSRTVSATDLVAEATYTTNYITLGVVLSVTPQISADGVISLDVTPVISRLVRMESVQTATNVTLATAPVVDVKQSSTMIRIKDGQMVVIAGLIKEDTSESVRKVPILGDIPGIGALFRGTYTKKDKNELVIFLTPRIVKD